MGFPSTLKDANGIPVSSVYIPGVGWAALQGSTNSNTDVNGTSAPAMITVTQFVQDQILQGHGFSVTTGLIASATNTNLHGGLDLVWNNVAKNVLIFNWFFTAAKGFPVTDAYLASLSSATADNTMTQSVASSIVNLQAGSGTTSVITTAATRAAGFTTDAQLIGTNFLNSCSTANVAANFLQNGAFIYIPKNTVAQYIAYINYANAANNAAVSAQWIEWT